MTYNSHAMNHENKVREVTTIFDSSQRCENDFNIES